MYKYLLYFLIFSFFGWCAEVLFYIFKTGRLVNRGLAKGPFCPIYGLGICLCALLLGSVESFFLLALFSMAIATGVEFFVGFTMDRVFDRKLWDYSLERGNILGYVCPRFSIIWGVVCALVIRLLPRIDPFLTVMDAPVGYTAVFLATLIIVVDCEIQMLRKQRT